MIPVDIPRPLMTAMTCDWDIDWRGQSAGVSNDGNRQTIYNRFPQWYGSPSIVLHGSLIDEWRAVRSRAQGRVRAYRVPMIDRTRGTGKRDVTFSTGRRFSTGRGLAYLPAAICVQAAGAGSSELLLAERDEPIEVGQFMSHDDWPFYVVWKDTDGANVRIGIEMPLRRSIPLGAEVMLRATGLFMATDDTMGNPSFDVNLISKPQLSFVEWLGPGR